MESSLATREIMWNIPPSFKYLMYFLFGVSLLVLAKGLYEKYLFLTHNHQKSLFGKGGLLPDHIRDLNWKNFFRTIFLQGKVRRRGFVGLFHGFIYYGFIILWIATDLVAIHYDTPFKVFQGTTYIVISFLADFAALFMIAGIALAFYRRYQVKPSYLSSTRPQNELFMYGILLNLVVIGLLIEGLRILGTDPVTQAMTHEKVWAPIGWSIAKGLSTLSLSEDFLSGFYRFLWFFHMVSTMVFIGAIGYSKFSHILLAPFSALITPARRGGVIPPMNFEDESAETFGLGKVGELTLKQKFDTMVCVECGRCTQVCPANQAGKPLNPKTIITKMRDLIQETALPKIKADPKIIKAIEANGDPLGDLKTHINALHDVAIWDEAHPLYFANELDACTTCGACMEECPVNIEHVPMIMDLKRYKVLTLGDIPPSAADAANKIKINGNPWGIAQADRFKWADGMDIPVITAGKKVDYLYYVGCAGSYDPSNQKVVKDTLNLMKAANVSFAVMGKTEKCNGDPIRRFGDEYSFNEIAIENITSINQYEFDKIVTHCPHCLHTIGKEYAKFEEGKFTVIHHTELLHQLLREGKLKPQKAINEERTYHDPCYLGRHHGQYDAPRDILESIPGIKLKEMKRSKDTALCCGMGGGNMWYELPEGEHLANNRLEDISQTKVQKLSTACSYCMINFNSAKGHKKETENMEVEDIASTLAKSVL